MRISLFTIGDASDVNTWSNVPYFVTKALKYENVDIVHLNLEPHYLCRRTYKYLISLPLKNFFRLTGIRYDFSYFRSIINEWQTKGKIKHYIRNSEKSDCNLFLTFSYSSSEFSNTPVIHLCDQLYEEVLLNRNLTPNFFERKIINREIEVLRKAHHVFSTNLSTIKLLKGKYGLINCSELNYRVNLDIDKIKIDEEYILKLKFSNRNVLFIGKGYYERGVDILLKAFRLFNEKVSNSYTLNIIGPFNPSILSEEDKNVFLFGYLRKDKEEDYLQYTNLLQKATMFVFPMRFGPLPAALFEANYFYTPAIITNIHEIGNDIKNYENGILVDIPDPNGFAEKMYELSSSYKLWVDISINSHKHAAKFTLSEMAKTIIRHVPLTQDNL